MSSSGWGWTPPMQDGCPKSCSTPPPLSHAKASSSESPSKGGRGGVQPPQVHQCPVWGQRTLPQGGDPSRTPPALTIVSPGHENVLQAAVRLVHPVLGAGDGVGSGAWGWTPLHPPSPFPGCDTGCGAQHPTAACPGGPASPVQGVSGVGVVVEGGVPEDHGPLHLAAHRESVPHHGPLQRGATGVPLAQEGVPKEGSLASGIPRTPVCPLSTVPLTWGSPKSARTFPRSCSSPTRWNQSGGKQGCHPQWDTAPHGLCVSGGGGQWPYLCQGGPGGCPRRFDRHGRSWGSPRPGRTRPPAGPAVPVPPWRSSCAGSRSRTRRSVETAGTGDGDPLPNLRCHPETPRDPPRSHVGSGCPPSRLVYQGRTCST